MAREWSLQETQALVEEHICLKQQERPAAQGPTEVRTASEHWNKVAKRLRERGFSRSHKSCNKRWYRLEQYEVQIFSFNMAEGKLHRNYWHLTHAERLECRARWPQLPSGDGIDKDIFDSLKRFSCPFDKEAPLSCAVDKEVVLAAPDTGFGNRPSAPAPVAHAAAPVPLPLPPPPIVVLPAPVAAVLVPAVAAEPKASAPSDEIEPEKEVKGTSWPASTANKPSALSSQEALDGFKLQARELRRRRAAELRRNHRTVPYNTTHTTFVKANPQSLPPGPQSPPPPPPVATLAPAPAKGAAPFGDPVGKTFNTENLKVGKESAPLSKEHVHIKKAPSTGLNSGSILYKVDVNPVPQSINQPQQQLPIGSHLGAQVLPPGKPKIGHHHPALQQHPVDTAFAKHHAGIEQQGAHAIHQSGHVIPQGTSTHLPLLQSINSHLPLLQPKDTHMDHQQHKVAAAEGRHHAPLDGGNLPPELLQLGSLEEQLQVILGVHHGPLLAQTPEQQLLMSNGMDGGVHASHQAHQGSGPFRRQVPGERHGPENMGPNASLLGAAIGGLEVQLGALVSLLKGKHAAEQQFREKLLLFVECMVVSLHTMAQANARTGG